MADEPEKPFLTDMECIFAQHAAMWSVYTESLKILVSITSLPVLAAAVVLSVSKDGNAIDFANLPPVLVWTLFLLPILDLLLLGVVIQHRLVILFYARALNGYRRIYLQRWNAGRKPGDPELKLPMPTNPAYPENWERAGPMGLIVHCSGLVNGIYAFGAMYTWVHGFWRSILTALAVLVIYEWWYFAHCRRATNRRNDGQPPPVPPPPKAGVPPVAPQQPAAN